MAATGERVELTGQSLRDAVAASGVGSVLVVGSELEAAARAVLYGEEPVPDLKLHVDSGREGWEIF